MTIANFFDKAALAASQVLSNYDRGRFLTELESMCPSLVFDRAAVESQEGRTTLLLLANLNARLYPRLKLVPQDQESSLWSQELVRLVAAINPQIDLSAPGLVPTFSVVVGGTSYVSQAPVRYIGSSGWQVRISGTAPVQSAQTDNPFGAAAVACIAAANTFRHGFASQLAVATLDENLDFSLLGVVAGRVWPEADGNIGSVDISTTVLAGVGAIGQAVLWCLMRLPSVRGELVAVDPESVAISNLQRYLLSLQSDVSKPKVEVALQSCSPALTIIPHAKTWGAYLDQRADWSLGRVLTALDSAWDRSAVQAGLPRLILNAWTGQDNCGVSRHDFDSANACLTCLYMPTGQVPSEDVLIRSALGLGPEMAEIVKRMLATGEPMQADLLGAIASAKNIALDALRPFEGMPLRTFYADAVCGGVLLSLGDNVDGSNSVEAPMAFQSAMAGVLLAMELVVDARGLRSQSDLPVTTLNLLRPLAGLEFSFAQQKAPGGGCICQDQDYLDAYRRKHAP